ncbi:sensor histidine kinase [Novosphingobium sp. PP1Y]|uniref:sensor histidine kinase n=1 Tax=Novosphingobium sp. PP1Y TaxID=702113 RepID=UPI0011D1A17A|nr:HAMP domain-containing sensor histidine kinase [Novosphingobium sp. PP1Y]
MNCDSNRNQHFEIEALRAERDELKQIFNDLQASIGLMPIRDVSFHPESARLSFLNASAQTAHRSSHLQIHPDDCELLKAHSASDHASVELRLATQGLASFILVLRKNTGNARWASGLLANIREPRHLIEAVSAKSRLADLGERTSAIVHEIRQPLFTIAMANENLRLMLDTPGALKSRMQKSVARIADQVARAQNIVQRTLSYVSTNGAESQFTDLPLTLANTVEFLDSFFESDSIQVRLDIPHETAMVALEQLEVEQLFVNVLRNAADSIRKRRQAGWEGEGEIAISAKIRDDQVLCEVADNGAGLLRREASRCFERFYTTRKESGTGLGLYICEQFVAKAGGKIELSPREVGGARIEIRLPLIAGSDIVASEPD